MSTPPFEALSASRPAWSAWLEERGEKRFRADQVSKWLHVRGARAWEEMTDLPKGLRGLLSEQAELRGLTLAEARISRDGSRKVVLRTSAGLPVETVLIPMSQAGGGDVTQCVSSQVGCRMGCDFCATAQMAVRANLTAGEIVDQVVCGARLRRDAGEVPPPVAKGGPLWGLRPHNLVFMGMGEPLDNLDNVLAALGLLCDEALYGFAQRRITVSTSGLTKRIPRLVEAFPNVNLAVSLTATTNEVRDTLMPLNKGQPIEKLVETLTNLPQNPYRKLTFEYALLAGVNDSDGDAARLGALSRRLGAHVNAIPFNPYPGARYGRPSSERIGAFVRVLERAGGSVSVRESKGKDIGAACGQLAGPLVAAAAS